MRSFETTSKMSIQSRFLSSLICIDPRPFHRILLKRVGRAREKRTCLVPKSMKRNQEEVIALRRIYGSNLMVIGIHPARDNRIENLAELSSQIRRYSRVWGDSPVVGKPGKYVLKPTCPGGSFIRTYSEETA